MPRTLQLCSVFLMAAIPATALAQLSGREREDSATLRQPNALFDASTHDRKSELLVHGVYQWGIGVGAGARYALPLVRDGVLPDYNDSITLEGGADFVVNTFALGAPFLRISAEPRWSFHIVPSFDLYVKLGAFFVLQFGGIPLSSPFGIQAAIGGVYRLGNGMSLRGETGVEGAKIAVGLEF
jgi:hypothetical protein